MPRRTAKFASAVFLGILASISLSTVSLGETTGANGCLSEPKGDTPSGSHWYYRVDHINKRNCWYLRRESEVSQAAPPQAAPPPASSPKPAAPSVSDARAELRHKAATESSPPVSAPATTSAVNSPWSAAPPTATATVATRWPDPVTTGSVSTTNSSGSQRPPPVLPNAAAASPALTDSVLPVPAAMLPTVAAATLGALALLGAAALILRRRRSQRVRLRPVRYGRAAVWETTDDDRIVVSDLPLTDSRDYRPRFARGVGLRGDRAAAESAPRMRRKAPR